MPHSLPRVWQTPNPFQDFRSISSSLLPSGYAKSEPNRSIDSVLCLAKQAR